MSASSLRAYDMPSFPFEQPWYHTAPAIGKSTIGSIIALCCVVQCPTAGCAPAFQYSPLSRREATRAHQPASASRDSMTVLSCAAKSGTSAMPSEQMKGSIWHPDQLSSSMPTGMPVLALISRAMKYPAAVTSLIVHWLTTFHGPLLHGVSRLGNVAFSWLNFMARMFG